jgi:hypothetical protein
LGKLAADCGCLAWNFNNNDSQGWIFGGSIRGEVCAEGTYGVGTAPAVLDGTYALSSDLQGNGTCGTGFSVSLCANGTSLSGLRASARLLFSPNRTTGSSSYTGSVSFSSDYNASGSVGTSYWRIDQASPIAADVWTTVTATLSSQPDGAMNSNFGFVFYPGTWVGTVWVDNVIIN